MADLQIAIYVIVIVITATMFEKAIRLDYPIWLILVQGALFVSSLIATYLSVFRGGQNRG